jgi:hypothetical protein
MLHHSPIGDNADHVSDADVQPLTVVELPGYDEWDADRARNTLAAVGGGDEPTPPPTDDDGLNAEVAEFLTDNLPNVAIVAVSRDRRSSYSVATGKWTHEARYLVTACRDNFDAKSESGPTALIAAEKLVNAWRRDVPAVQTA